MGEGNIEEICELWMVASQCVRGVATLSEWQRIWWMFRRYKRELELNDFDDDGDQRHDDTDVHRYIAAAYHESMSKLSDYTQTQAGRIAAAYRPVAEAESMGFLPPSGKKKKKKADATQGTAAPTPPLPADAVTSF